MKDRICLGRKDSKACIAGKWEEIVSKAGRLTKLQEGRPCVEAFLWNTHRSGSYQSFNTTAIWEIKLDKTEHNWQRKEIINTPVTKGLLHKRWKRMSDSFNTESKDSSWRHSSTNTMFFWIVYQMLPRDKLPKEQTALLFSTGMNPAFWTHRHVDGESQTETLDISKHQSREPWEHASF